MARNSSSCPLNLEEEQWEIFNRYRYALLHIGVDWHREDVQEALENCFVGLEDALRSVISCWYRGALEYPNAFLIQSLSQGWEPFQWQDEWMENPNFLSPAQKWWQVAEFGMGRDRRNHLIADILEPEDGTAWVIFSNGRSLPFHLVAEWDWQRVIEFAEQARGIPGF